jgi:DNA-binding MarR family transcriptional regulator
VLELVSVSSHFTRDEGRNEVERRPVLEDARQKLLALLLASAHLAEQHEERCHYNSGYHYDR